MGGEPNQVKWRGVRMVAGVEGVWPASYAVRVNESTSQVGVGTTIVYTVPVDKKLFISSAVLATRQSGTVASTGRVFVRDADDSDVFDLLAHLHDVADQLVSSMYYRPALEVAAGWDVCVESSQSLLDARSAFHGWLEDV